MSQKILTDELGNLIRCELLKIDLAGIFGVNRLEIGGWLLDLFWGLTLRHCDKALFSIVSTRSENGQCCAECV